MAGHPRPCFKLTWPPLVITHEIPTLKDERSAPPGLTSRTLQVSVSTWTSAPEHKAHTGKYVAALRARTRGRLSHRGGESRRSLKDMSSKCLPLYDCHVGHPAIHVRRYIVRLVRVFCFFCSLNGYLTVYMYGGVRRCLVFASRSGDGCCIVGRGGEKSSRVGGTPPTPPFFRLLFFSSVGGARVCRSRMISGKSE